MDRAGNTPLHYASKYGHLELCRYLIEVGASPGRKNNSHQTPYDAAAEHHTVRQYLLPLQFQAERNAAESSGDYSVHSQAHMGQTSDGYQMQTNHNFNYSHGTAAPGAYGTNSPPPPQGYAPHPAAHFGMAVPMAAQSESHTFAHNPSPPPAAGPTGVATFGPPTVNFPTNTSASAPMYNNVRPVAATTRIIQPGIVSVVFNFCHCQHVSQFCFVCEKTDFTLLRPTPPCRRSTDISS